MAELDSGFQSYGATLINKKAPYDPFSDQGDKTDTAWYVLKPGSNFLRPWIAIRSGPAFRWPLGIEGYSHTIDAELGIHKFVGDNRVAVDVIHRGEEHITINGTFPGKTAPSNWLALKDITMRATPDEGKILYLPFVSDHAQRVAILHAEASRAEDNRGMDLNYSIEAVRIGEVDKKDNFGVVQPVVQGKATGTPSSNFVKVDSLHNTLRKIAAWKYGSGVYWRILYNLNQTWFTQNHVPITQAPDYRLPLGLTIYY